MINKIKNQNFQNSSYDNFAQTFSASRKNMKWEEIDYFMDYLWKEISEKKILDIWCGNGRLLSTLKVRFQIQKENYLGIDLSKELLKEAQKLHPWYNFLTLDMLELEKLEIKDFDYIFFIASFHHLDSFEKRKKVLDISRNILNKNGIIFMTNWDLESPLNKEKYKDSMIKWSENNFWSKDFNIKIGKYTRYYHSFSLRELETLFQEWGFSIQENRLFNTEKNIISLIRK